MKYRTQAVVEAPMTTVRRKLFFVLSLLIASLLVSGSAHAQFTTAHLSGVVTDGTGSSIPQAKVSIKEINSDYRHSTVASSDGSYAFPSLPVGTYELSVGAPGFSTYLQKGIELTLGQAATQNIALQIGAVTQEVSVEANASLVTTDSAALSQLIGAKSMIALPLNGREAQQLVFLSPGAVDVSSQNCGAGCEGGVLPGEQYAKINGGTSNGVAYLLDGVDYNDTYVNANLPFPNPDALQEFNVQTDNMSAVYGNAVGGVVNIITKSGTD